MPAREKATAPRGRIRPKGAAKNRPRRVRLLAVGNSFSWNATRYLPDIVRRAGGERSLVFADACIGGASLERHWRHVLAHEADRDDSQGKPYRPKGLPWRRRNVSLVEMLRADKWDFVTIQQASTLSTRIGTFRPYGKLLHDYIREHAPQAEVLVHQTWAYRADDFPEPGTSQGRMYARLKRAYDNFAREIGCRQIPVGDAFQNARMRDDWRFVHPDPNFNYRRPRFPDLPDQRHSLNVGYVWVEENGRHRLAMDSHHASRAGEYLAACVWFEFLYRLSVVGNAYVPRSMRVSDAAVLQEVAHETLACHDEGV